MLTQNDLKPQVLEVLDTLPDESLPELATFLDYLQYKLGRRPPQLPSAPEQLAPAHPPELLPQPAAPAVESLSAPTSDLTLLAGLIKQLTKVGSSMLYAVGYDESTQVLEVVFYNGGIYRYFGVPPAVYAGLLAAESIGRYMHAHVIGHYSYERLESGKT